MSGRIRRPLTDQEAARLLATIRTVAAPATTPAERTYTISSTYGRSHLVRQVSAPDWGAAMFHAQACLAALQRRHPRSAWNRPGAVVDLRNAEGETIAAFVIREARP